MQESSLDLTSSNSAQGPGFAAKSKIQSDHESPESVSTASLTPLLVLEVDIGPKAEENRYPRSRCGPNNRKRQIYNVKTVFSAVAEGF